MKKLAVIVLFSLIFCSYLYSQQYDDLQAGTVSNDKLKQFPGPESGKNYFFLQSIDDKTQIVIGDFTGVDKKIILITLNPDYNTIRSVVEYNPIRKEMRLRKTSESKFFTTDIDKLKRDIITGAIYKGNNAASMKSFGDLESVFKVNDISKITIETFGFNVKLAEVDETSKLSGAFSFGNATNGYYLQFKTLYYRENPKSVVAPPLRYSVYSRDTHDPVIKEYVEALFKIRKPTADYVR